MYILNFETLVSTKKCNSFLKWLNIRCLLKEIELNDLNWYLYSIFNATADVSR